MMNFINPIPTRLPKKAIEKLAAHAAKKLDFKPGDDIFEIARRLGGRIKTGSTGDEDCESGSLIARSISDWTIYLSPITSLVRDKFTIAHELGHLILHLPKVKEQNPDKPMRATRYMKNGVEQHKRAEWEANWFASAFLMPEEEFKRVFEEGGEDACRLYFQVSNQAIKIRVKSLGLKSF